VPIEDAEMTRAIRREISRRYIDSSSLDVRVMHGVVYLRGWVDKLHGAQGSQVDLKEEMELIHRILVQKPGIRDVIVEVEYGKGRTPAGGPGYR
jgi:hypothetical protein